MQATQAIIIISVILAAVILVALGAQLWSRRQRGIELRERFGPEYERTVRQTGDRDRAEKELESRQERVKTLNIRPLTEPDQERFEATWGSVQSQFVDDPAGALHKADELVLEVMQTRGYPVGKFDQQMADVSVDHPQVVSHYLAAHAVEDRAEHAEASTDDMRDGLLHYRALFEELVGNSTDQAGSTRTVGVRQ
jgi:hypothetical protein